VWYNWRTHAHRKVLIGCCPALHDAIYWLRVQYPVARDNIEQKSWVEVAQTADKGRRGDVAEGGVPPPLFMRNARAKQKRFWPFAF